MHKIVQDLGSTTLGEISPILWGFRQYKYKKSTRQKYKGMKKEGTESSVPPVKSGILLT